MLWSTPNEPKAAFEAAVAAHVEATVVVTAENMDALLKQIPKHVACHLFLSMA